MSSPPPPPLLLLPFQHQHKRQVRFTPHPNDSGSTVTLNSFTSATTKLHFTEDPESYYAPSKEKSKHHRRGSEPTLQPLTRSSSSSSKTLSPLKRFWQWGKRRDEAVTTLIGAKRGNTIDERVDTTPRLRALRVQMTEQHIDYFIIPSEDGHLSEYTAPSERRREWISGFSGLVGTAIISRQSAYLFTDSRYWAQAQRELDANWSLQKVGSQGTKDWLEWVILSPRGSRIGIDSRMIGHERAMRLVKGLDDRGSKLIHPLQNLVDLVWEGRPERPKDAVHVQPEEYASKGAREKLSDIREWIHSQNVAVEQAGGSDSSNSTPALTPTSAASASEGSADTASVMGQYLRSFNGTLVTSSPGSPALALNANPNEKITAMFVSSLSGVAHMLNLRGSNDPEFMAYLLVALDEAVLFIDPAKISTEVKKYLDECGVSLRGYADVWTYLGNKGWGDGKIVINPNTPYAIPLVTGFKACHLIHSNPGPFPPQNV